MTTAICAGLLPILAADLTTEQKVLAVLAIAFAAYVIYTMWGKIRRARALLTAEEILKEAHADAERVRKDAAVEAKEELLKGREKVEQEKHEARDETREAERRLDKREDSLDRKVDVLNKKEKYIESLEESLSSKRKDIEDQQANLEKLVEQEMVNLRKISGLNEKDAVDMLMRRLEQEMDGECATLVSKRLEDARENAETQARRIIGIAIHRYAADQTVEAVVSSVPLTNDEMKGRIIGREGRNIRAFEKASGVDVIVDDTPGVVVVSGFDGVRREIARRAMERLVQDGRIHPSRIEEIVKQEQEEVDQIIKETGKQAAFDVGIHNLHPRLIELLGRLKFRTSYGQNVLQHSIEVCHLCGSLAAELNMDVQFAKRCGLLHDIGKAIDQEMEGSHPQIGSDVARRCGEKPEVIDAIANHHEDADALSIYTVLVGAADAMSAARPGARRESLERYIQRLERLEEIAGAFSGIDSAFAIQAGREVRVIANAEKLDDKAAHKACRDIAKAIEEEMTYPGEIKVTLLRESRFVEKAK